MVPVISKKPCQTVVVKMPFTDIVEIKQARATVTALFDPNAHAASCCPSSDALTSSFPETATFFFKIFSHSLTHSHILSILFCLVGDRLAG